LKLLNHTLSYLSIALFAVIGGWAFVFYINMLDEIYDSIDDGLANSKILIIEKVKQDTSLISKNDFVESNYAIHEISEQEALHFRDVYADSTLYMINEADYEPVRILRTAFKANNQKYYKLEIVSSMVEEDDLIEDLFYAVMWLYFILLASILIINNVLLKRIWKPFYDILDKLKSFRVERSTEFPSSKSSITEFNDLNETVSELLQRTITTFNNQKQFIENASHELQTPLAISINRLELMSEKNTFTGQQLAEISSVIQSLERLTRINKTLLLLAKIENNQFTDESTVNLDELTNQVVNSFSDLSEYKSVTISLHSENVLIVRMNPELAGVMISNLLKNAIIHNYKSGRVEVRLSKSQIVVKNTSTTLRLDDTQIFGRFYKNSSNNSSTGLGLAIVKSIVTYYGFRIHYNFDGSHIFTIQFPVNE
jgi:signal transduction histidine kinase